MTEEDVSAVLITGPIGSGKTALAVEAAAMLADKGLRAAVIDLDWLGWFHGLGDASVDDLIVSNLRAVWPNFRAAGTTFVLMTRGLLTEEQVYKIRGALPGVPIRLVHVIASHRTIEERLQRRDAGRELDEHRDWLDSMSNSEDNEFDEAVRIDNDSRPISDVAGELLRLLGWPGP